MSELADAFLNWFIRFAIVSFVVVVGGSLLVRKLTADHKQPATLTKNDSPARTP